MTSRDLNDSLQALFDGDTGPVRTEPVREPVHVTIKPATEQFIEGCPKCRGTGRFISYSGRQLGECFACKGAGSKTFKSSSADRAQSRDKAASRKAARVQEWRDSCKAELAWLATATERQLQGPFIKWDFPIKLTESLNQYGTLTDGQIGAIRKCMDRDAARAVERAAQAAARVADAPSVDTAGVDRLKASFDQAVAYNREKGLRLSPRITIDGVTISPAKADSRNPGALYVKDAGTYVGKIVNGRFLAANANGQEIVTKVQAFIADPAEAAKVYGQTTGTCCICNATLTSNWKLRGIGPICAEKFGW